MANAETRSHSDNLPERRPSSDMDLATMRAFMRYTTPEPLIDLIHEKDGSDLVRDAVIDADTFYGNDTRRYSDTPAVMFPYEWHCQHRSKNQSLQPLLQSGYCTR
ncbi:MAG: hypothetical protein H0W89_01155 [Candidatus Levybacteria bacterium]|nr:hypothetical protein [Candidatus Levybacteria bacterium]